MIPAAPVMSGIISKIKRIEHLIPAETVKRLYHVMLQAALIEAAMSTCTDASLRRILDIASCDLAEEACRLMVEAGLFPAACSEQLRAMRTG